MVEITESVPESMCSAEILEEIQNEFEAFESMYEEVIIEKPAFAVVLMSALLPEKEKPKTI